MNAGVDDMAATPGRVAQVARPSRTGCPAARTGCPATTGAGRWPAALPMATRGAHWST
jgi:hypothetical protein